MSEKVARQVRKEMNALRKNKENVANDIILELLNSTFKYRFKFAMKLLFYKRKKIGKVNGKVDY